MLCYQPRDADSEFVEKDGDLVSIAPPTEVREALLGLDFGERKLDKRQRDRTMATNWCPADVHSLFYERHFSCFNGSPVIPTAESLLRFQDKFQYVLTYPIPFHLDEPPLKVMRAFWRYYPIFVESDPSDNRMPQVRVLFNRKFSRGRIVREFGELTEKMVPKESKGKAGTRSPKEKLSSIFSVWDQYNPSATAYIPNENFDEYRKPAPPDDLELAKSTFTDQVNSLSDKGAAGRKIRGTLKRCQELLDIFGDASESQI